MQNRRHINMLVEIITDEQKHAQKLNYLIFQA
jgi:rubrerythrin